MKIWSFSLIILLFANACQAQESKLANSVTKTKEVLEQSSNSPHVPKYKIEDTKAKNKELADQVTRDIGISSKPDGPIRTIRFADNTNIAVEPIKIVGRPSGMFAEDCAVRIDGGLTVTIGEEGNDSWIVFCNKLLEIGSLPKANMMRQIALIYNVGRPNDNFINLVVLVESSPGNWTVDNAAFEKMNYDSGPKTISEMIKWMNEHAKPQ
jgi:hypothetical protein